MYQLYYDYNKEGQVCKMEIYPFKAENCGEWLGQFGLYIESKPYFDDEPLDAEPQMGAGKTSFSNAHHNENE